MGSDLNCQGTNMISSTPCDDDNTSNRTLVIDFPSYKKVRFPKSIKNQNDLLINILHSTNNKSPENSLRTGFKTNIPNFFRTQQNSTERNTTNINTFKSNKDKDNISASIRSDDLQIIEPDSKNLIINNECSVISSMELKELDHISMRKTVKKLSDNYSEAINNAIKNDNIDNKTARDISNKSRNHIGIFHQTYNQQENPFKRLNSNISNNDSSSVDFYYRTTEQRAYKKNKTLLIPSRLTRKTIRKTPPKKTKKKVKKIDFSIENSNNFELIKKKTSSSKIRSSSNTKNNIAFNLNTPESTPSIKENNQPMRSSSFEIIENNIKNNNYSNSTSNKKESSIKWNKNLNEVKDLKNNINNNLSNETDCNILSNGNSNQNSNCKTIKTINEVNAEEEASIKNTESKHTSSMKNTCSKPLNILKNFSSFKERNQLNNDENELNSKTEQNTNYNTFNNSLNFMGRISERNQPTDSGTQTGTRGGSFSNVRSLNNKINQYESKFKKFTEDVSKKLDDNNDNYFKSNSNCDTNSNITNHMMTTNKTCNNFYSHHSTHSAQLNTNVLFTPYTQGMNSNKFTSKRNALEKSIKIPKIYTNNSSHGVPNNRYKNTNVHILHENKTLRTNMPNYRKNSPVRKSIKKKIKFSNFGNIQNDIHNFYNPSISNLKKSDNSSMLNSLSNTQAFQDKQGMRSERSCNNIMGMTDSCSSVIDTFNLLSNGTNKFKPNYKTKSISSSFIKNDESPFQKSKNSKYFNKNTTSLTIPYINKNSKISKQVLKNMDKTNSEINLNFTILKTLDVNDIILDGLIYKILETKNGFKFVERYFQITKNCFRYYANYNEDTLKPLVQFDIRFIKQIEIMNAGSLKKLFKNQSDFTLDIILNIHLTNTEEFFVLASDLKALGIGILNTLCFLKEYYNKL